LFGQENQTCGMIITGCKRENGLRTGLHAQSSKNFMKKCLMKSEADTSHTFVFSNEKNKKILSLLQLQDG
jgi:hypothetical protein